MPRCYLTCTSKALELLLCFQLSTLCSPGQGPTASGSHVGGTPSMGQGQGQGQGPGMGMGRWMLLCSCPTPRELGAGLDNQQK